MIGRGWTRFTRDRKDVFERTHCDLQNWFGAWICQDRSSAVLWVISTKRVGDAHPRATRGSVRAPSRGVMQPCGDIRPRGRDADRNRAIVEASRRMRSDSRGDWPGLPDTLSLRPCWSTGLARLMRARGTSQTRSARHEPLARIPTGRCGGQASLRQAWNLTSLPTLVFGLGTRSSMSVPRPSRGRGPSSELSTGQPESLVRESRRGPKSPH